MPSSIEHALVTLVPSLNSLPQELTSLAGSLLAQSRARATNLKPDEEIGRTYACAHIACDRLKQRLGLEKLQPHPPCPPRVYKKLYNFLDKTLTASLTPQTPRHRDALAPAPRQSGTRSAGTPAPRSGRSLTVKEEDTPTKTATTVAHQDEEQETPSHRREKHAPRPTGEGTTPEVRRSGKRKRTSTAVEDNLHVPDAPKEQEQGTTHAYDMPSFVPKMIMQLCTDLGVDESYGPAILDGLRSVISRRGYGPTFEDRTASAPTTPTKSQVKMGGKTKPAAPRSPVIEVPRIPALLFVLTLYASMQIKYKDTEVDANKYRILRAQGIESVRKMEEGYLQGDEDIMADIAVFMKAAVAEEWLQGDWWTAICASAGDSAVEEAAVEEEDVPMQDAPEAAENDPMNEVLAENGDMVEEEDVVAASTPVKRAKQANTPLHRAEKHATLDEDDSAAGLKPGLGTMFQDAVDWLSEDRRAEYAAWEKSIRAQLAKPSRAQRAA